MHDARVQVTLVCRVHMALARIHERLHANVPVTGVRLINPANKNGRARYLHTQKR